jgi:transcriptional regulator with XRE-family HTH domain
VTMARNAGLGGPDPVDVHVGLRLRELRRSRKLSQPALARSVGVTFQQINKYEKGVNRISASMLYGIARTLAVPLTAFFEGLPDPEAGDSG